LTALVRAGRGVPCPQGNSQEVFKKSAAIRRFTSSFMPLLQWFDANSLCRMGRELVSPHREFFAGHREFSNLAGKLSQRGMQRDPGAAIRHAANSVAMLVRKSRITRYPA
jgi:hypothetical protein